MNMKPFTLTGTVKLIQRKLFMNGSECYGTTTGHGGKFQIRLSNLSIETVWEFIETTVHELLHLWLFILVSALTFTLSDAASHRIIEETVKTALRALRRELRNKRRTK